MYFIKCVKAARVPYIMSFEAAMTGSDRYERGSYGSILFDKDGMWRLKKVKQTGELKRVLIIWKKNQTGSLVCPVIDPATGNPIEKDYVREEQHWEVGETVDKTNYDRKRYDPRTGRYESLREKWKRRERERERLERVLREERRKNGTLSSNDEYSSDDSYGGSGGSSKTQADWDNYSNQLNPNNSAYHSSRR